jgi:23S rRNA (guanine2445-N2)-methyltransferase / 23S rRNA (guanine2069-N7)-methyltransferase
MQFFATCPKGLESLVQDEILELGAVSVRMTSAGVYFEGDIRLAMRVCLYSRLANRILLPLAVEDVASDYDLYSAAYGIAWHEHLAPDTTFAVDFTGTNDAINNTQFGAMRVKDAVVDKIRDHTGQRPSVDRHQPRFRINARLAKNKVHIGIDLSGESLHRRGYRLEQGAAPLKENLAAAILLRAQWPAIAKSGGDFIDPMCGSGTFLVEAALMAAQIAPGIYREHFGFFDWLASDMAAWQEMKAAAIAHQQAQFAQGLPQFLGVDQFPKVLDAARNNIARAGLTPWISVQQISIAAFTRPAEFRAGLLLTNPPYGERLGDIEPLFEVYADLGRVIKTQCAGWRLGVFTGNQELGKALRLRADKRYKFFNGTIASELLLFDVLSGEQAQWREDKPETQAAPAAPEPLTEGAQMLANRLRKNLKQFKPWVASQGIEAYRVYDADMPEYAAAIDYYAGRLHVQEYAAPKSIDEAAAAKRFAEIIAAVEQVFDVRKQDIAIKKRQRNKGKLQYEKLEEPLDADYFSLREGEVELWVHLKGYLDTGLFLDHRPLRLRLAQEAYGKKFLNLFCYTATASVHAILGGAQSSVSVDMSNTYLHWARRNYQLNGIHSARHALVQSDCFKWLRECREGFDLIMLDPPSFSNSKRMDDVLDVQRDHVRLVQRCVELLRPGGVLYFSTNLRSFKLDYAALGSLQVEDISAATLDKDYARNPKIHYCFRITQA